MHASPPPPFPCPGNPHESVQGEVVEPRTNFAASLRAKATGGMLAVDVSIVLQPTIQWRLLVACSDVCECVLFVSPCN
jgi:hypothetical protein